MPQNSLEPYFPPPDMAESVESETEPVVEFDGIIGIGGGDPNLLVSGASLWHVSMMAAREGKNRAEKQQIADPLSSQGPKRRKHGQFVEELVSFNGQPCSISNVMPESFNRHITGDRVNGDNLQVHGSIRDMGHFFGRKEVKSITKETLLKLWENGSLNKFDFAEFTLGESTHETINSNLSCLFSSELCDQLIAGVNEYNRRTPSNPILFDETDDTELSIMPMKISGAHDVLHYMSGFLVPCHVGTGTDIIRLIDVGVSTVLPCAIEFFVYIDSTGKSRINYALLIPGPVDNPEQGLESKLVQPVKSVYGKFKLNKDTGLLTHSKMTHSVSFNSCCISDNFAAQHITDPTAGFQNTSAIINYLFRSGLNLEQIRALLDSNPKVRHLISSSTFILGLKKPNSLVGQSSFDMSFGGEFTFKMINLSATMLAQELNRVLKGIIPEINDTDVIQLFLDYNIANGSALSANGSALSANGSALSANGGSALMEKAPWTGSGGFFTKKNIKKKYIGGGDNNIIFNTPQDFVSQLFKHLHVNNTDLYNSLIENLKSIDDCFDFFMYIRYNTTIGAFYLSKVNILTNENASSYVKRGGSVQKEENIENKKRKISELATGVANASSISSTRRKITIRANRAEVAQLRITTDVLFPELCRIVGRPLKTPSSVTQLNSEKDRSYKQKMECASSLYDLKTPFTKRSSMIILHDVLKRITASNPQQLIDSIYAEGRKIGREPNEMEYIVAFCCGIDRSTKEENKHIFGEYVIDTEELFKAYTLTKNPNSEHYFMGYLGKEIEGAAVQDPQRYRSDPAIAEIIRRMRRNELRGKPNEKTTTKQQEDLKKIVERCEKGGLPEERFGFATVNIATRRKVAISQPVYRNAKQSPPHLVNKPSLVGRSSVVNDPSLVGRSSVVNDPSLVGRSSYFPLDTVKPPPDLPTGPFTLGIAPNKSKKNVKGRKSGKGGK
jgi:hypothetical protein